MVSLHEIVFSLPFQTASPNELAAPTDVALRRHAGGNYDWLNTDVPVVAAASAAHTLFLPALEEHHSDGAFARRHPRMALSSHYVPSS